MSLGQGGPTGGPSGAPSAPPQGSPQGAPQGAPQGPQGASQPSFQPNLRPAIFGKLRSPGQLPGDAPLTGAELQRYSQDLKRYQDLSKLQEGLRNSIVKPGEYHGFTPSFRDQSHVDQYQDFITENMMNPSPDMYAKLFHMEEIIKHNREAAVQEYLAGSNNPMARANRAPAAPKGANPGSHFLNNESGNSDSDISTEAIFKRMYPADYQQVMAGQRSIGDI